jgi:hypothetical protein
LGGVAYLLKLRRAAQTDAVLMKFNLLRPGMLWDEAQTIVGKPTSWSGGMVRIEIYMLPDGSKMVVETRSRKLSYVYRVRGDNSAQGEAIEAFRAITRPP